MKQNKNRKKKVGSGAKQKPGTDLATKTEQNIETGAAQTTDTVPDEKEEEGKTDVRKDSLPIIVLGASAGGLEAFEQVFKNLPSNTGASFIVISHLDPKHSSMMSELIARFTGMRVREAANDVQIEPNHVYVIPPNTDLSISKNKLQVVTQERTQGIRMPIDFFLKSLAEEQSDRNIAVILSGTGTDGTLGVRSLQAAGGLIFVQDPSDAKYDGMPRSAIQTGLADYVLPANQIGRQLAALIARYPQMSDTIARSASLDTIHKVLMVVRAKTGHDFSMYKKNTVTRRIQRRMNIHNLEKTEEYVNLLRQRPEEVNQLFKELLINVTSFFREPEAFQAFKTIVLPLILHDKPEDYTMRIWVPGCATGEEAYSIAMAVREYSTDMGKDYRIQMFATDLDEKSIVHARSAFFPSNIALDVPPSTLTTYFVKEENGYRVRKDIRESIVFAIQDAAKDAPFTRLDLVSCRNMLIYMEPELQNKLMAIFHYSLKSGGILFLGSSESVGSRSDLFRIIDKHWKFFQVKPGVSRDALTYSSFANWPVEPMNVERVIPQAEPTKKTNIEQMVYNTLLSIYAPPAIVVNEKGEILFISGDTAKYLTPAPGRPTADIAHMTREGLTLSMRSALLAAVSHQQKAVYRNIRVKINNHTELIDLSITPLPQIEEERTLFLFTFRTVIEEKPESKQKGRRDQRQDTDRVTELEKELVYTRESLQAAAEEAQAANEELKSANEELQSSNEELQSTNEELETSKEELQSVNEELTTVNAELRSKIDQLSQSESDIKNLLDSTDIATIFLDGQFNIKRYNSSATKVINLIPSDIGRQIDDVSMKVDAPSLLEKAREVIAKLRHFEMDVVSKEGTWYRMRIIPYRTLDNVIDGVVLTFADITDAKRAIGGKGQFVSSLVQMVDRPFAVLDKNLRVTAANQQFLDLFGEEAHNTMDRSIWELGKGHWKIDQLEQILSETISLNKVFVNHVVEGDFASLGHRTITVNARRTKSDEPHGPTLILLSIEERAGGK